MLLKTILFEFLPSKEIKQRFNNRQIKLNNEVVSNLNIDIPIQAILIVEEGIKDKVEGYWELGDFLFYNYQDNQKILAYLDVKDFFGEEFTNIASLQFLTGYTLISISKKEHYVFINQ